MYRRTFSCAAIGLAALMASAGALAQNYPSKPIILAIGFPPGGSTDQIGRAFAQKLSEVLGQSVVVENRTGATGAIMAAQVARAEPDGYRILLQNSGTFTYSVLSRNVQYDLERDFTPITHVAVSPLVLVAGPSFKPKTLAEVIGLARSQPGTLTFGSEGIGGTSHLAGEQLSKMAGVKMTHVPFKSAVDSTLASATGDINMAFSTLSSALSLLQGNRIRVVAVGTTIRSSLYPDVPTIDESGYRGFDQGAWFGFVGPAKMPAAVVERLNAAITQVANMPDVKESLRGKGVEVQVKGPADFGAFMRKSAADMAQLAKDVNLKLD